MSSDRVAQLLYHAGDRAVMCAEKRVAVQHHVLNTADVELP